VTRTTKPPSSERTLARYVAAHARETGADVARVRRLISFMAMAGALRQSAREDGERRFVVKGGVALELRLRDRARATRDLDVILDRDDGDPLEALEEALAGTYEGFAFRRKGEAFRMPNGAIRVKVQVSFLGREWGTVEVDVARREGETEVDLLPAIPLLEQFGLTGPDELECISLRHHVAQKFHAVTRPIPGGGQNDRFRDLVDLLLMRQLVQDYAALRQACEEVFARRATHAWPPVIAAPESWAEPFARMAEETGLPIRDLADAVTEVERFMAEIVAAQATPESAKAAELQTAGEQRRRIVSAPLLHTRAR
jgi:hypothetical protein